jgi:2-amino-4-hydroxy-6-hydroxymethyldihydropteridine diphosphokinase
MNEYNIDDLIIVAIGGNLPGPMGSIVETLESALTHFPSSELKIAKRSSWWRSRAWPDPSAPDYINGVVIVETALEPLQVLERLAAIEHRFGRQRLEVNAPRSLDLDLIAHGRTRLQTKALILPHPRAHDRLFVMGPLAELAPSWRCPNTGLTALHLALQAGVGRDARPI